MLGSLLTFLAVGILTLIAAGVVLSVLGTALGFASFLLFKVGPLLLVGWVVVKVLENKKKNGYLSEADRRYLEGE